MKIPSIIHPTDFSKCAMVALEYAIQLAKVYNCELILVHSLDFSELDGHDAAGYSLIAKTQEIERNTEKNLKDMGDSVVKKGVNCSAKLYTGSLTSWLPDLIKELRPTLVVMGTTGAGSISNKIFGSNTYDIIQSSISPVIAVPVTATYHDIKKMTLAANLETVESEVIKYAVKFTSLFKAELEIIYVQSEKKRALATSVIEKFNSDIFKYHKLKDLDCKLIIDDDYITGISLHIIKNNPDLFAIVMSNKNFFEKFLFGSLSEKMIHNSDTPLLVIPQNMQF